MLCLFCQILNICSWLKMFTLCKFIPCILAQPLKEADEHIVDALGFCGSSKIIRLEILIVAAVQ